MAMNSIVRFHSLEASPSDGSLPYFLSINQDIVAQAQEKKCELEYVMLSPNESLGEFRPERLMFRILK